MNLRVTKRTGQLENIDLNKFHKVCAWACEGVTGVSASEIELKSQIQFYDKIPTASIQETLINAAASLISEDTPNYQYVAGRLVNYHLRKQVYGQYEPIDFLTHVKNVVKLGFYDTEILDLYTETEFKELNNYIKHERDFNIVYAGMEQFRRKYLIKNRVTGQIHETPQMAYMLIAMTLFSKYPKNTRLTWVKDYYDAISQFDISLPTPIMAGLRSPQRQFASCVLIESGDSLDSIITTAGSIAKYVSQKAGIGIGAGRIRAIGSQVRRGDTFHTGVIPFYKLFNAAVKSCSQGSVRSGAATLNYPIWHLEVEDLLVLKNSKGIEQNRIRTMDYCVQFNRVIYERILTGGNITLFSPHDLPEMYEAFFNDADKFRELYEAAEANPSIRKKTVAAIDLIGSFITERKETSRIYLSNVDHVNDHGSFDKLAAPVRMTNLCCLTGDTWVTIQNEEGDLEDIQLKDVKVGHKIYSRNIKLAKNEFKPVLASALTRKNAKLMKITSEDGTSITCTPDHRIYTKNRGYVEAQHLNSDDILQLQ